MFGIGPWTARILGLSTTLLGCTIDPLDASGKACEPNGDCPSGYVCEAITATCVVACTGVCGTPHCGECPAAPVIADATDLALQFDIDSTEVTAASYQHFLDTRPVFSQQPAECAWNRYYDPRIDPSRDCARFFVPETSNAPATCIDWCDAYAYCQWTGRHLCGRIGGMPLPPEDHDNEIIGEWFRACSDGGSRGYPYSGAYDKSLCNTEMPTTGGALPVPAVLTCEGGFAGVFDMSGNVAEWENDCTPEPMNPDDPSDDQCALRGGSFASSPADARCNAALRIERSAAGVRYGFRCCGTPP